MGLGQTGFLCLPCFEWVEPSVTIPSHLVVQDLVDKALSLWPLLITGWALPPLYAVGLGRGEFELSPSVRGLTSPGVGGRLLAH